MEIDFDITPEPAEESQVPAPAVSSGTEQPDKSAGNVASKKAGVSPWTTGFAFLAVLFFGLWLREVVRDRGIVPNPDDDVVVIDPVDGVYVAIFYDNKQSSALTDSQREFLNSANTAQYLDERTTNWKRIDVDDDLAKLDPLFAAMASRHRTRLPWIVIASGKKYASEPIESAEQASALLKKWLK